MSGKQKTIQLAPASPEVAGLVKAAAEATEAMAEHARVPPPFLKGTALAVVLQWCEADLAATLRLIKWIGDLNSDNNPLPPFYLYRPSDTPPAVSKLVQDAAEAAHLNCAPLVPPFDLPDERYPRGSTWGFINIARQMLPLRADFLLMEPDMVPLTKDWFWRLHDEWMNCKWPYFGHLEPAHPSGGYPKHMAGCGVYHHEVFRYFPFNRLDQAWDVALAEHVVPLAKQSVCIQQVFGATEPPRFRGQADVDRIIRKDAVLFHRNKDGSLIRLLRERMCL